MAEFDFSQKYTARPHFTAFHQRDHRWAALVCHRRAGKTVACIAELVTRAIKSKKHNPRYAYVAPFYKQAKEIAWVYLKEQTEGLAVEIRESDLRVVLPNGAWISLYGADNPDALRGIYLDGVILDEYGDSRPSLWGEVILPTLADRRGWCIFIGTMKGKNHFYDVLEMAKKDPNWFHMELKASDSGIIDDEELNEMRNIMDESQFLQEFECDPTAAVKGTYYAELVAKLETSNRTLLTDLYDPSQPVQVAADLGFSDSTAFWFWQERPDGIAVVDYYENQSKPLAHYIETLNNKPYEYETIWLPHDARAKTLQTGRSTVEQMLAEGFPCQITPNLRVQHGIDAVRMLLPECWFALEAMDGVERLRAYRRKYNELTKAFMDTPLHDINSDGSDAFRYLALVAQQRRGKSPKKEHNDPLMARPVQYSLNQLYDGKSKGTLSLAKRRI